MTCKWGWDGPLSSSYSDLLKRWLTWICFANLSKNNSPSDSRVSVLQITSSASSASSAYLSRYSFPILICCCLTETMLHSGLEEVLIVIQSQRDSYHARRGEQRKVEILQQAAELGQVIFGQLGDHCCCLGDIMCRSFYMCHLSVLSCMLGWRPVWPSDYREEVYSP